MRNVILSMMVSLDGMIARPDGDLDWFLSDDEYRLMVHPIVLARGLPLFRA